MKAKTDKTPENSKCRQCGNEDKTVNYTRRECNKLLPKEYKNRHTVFKQIIYWELCKQKHFDYKEQCIDVQTTNLSYRMKHIKPIGTLRFKPKQKIWSDSRKQEGYWILQPCWITKCIWKKVKSQISISTLPENWGSCTIWRWQSCLLNTDNSTEKKKPEKTLDVFIGKNIGCHYKFEYPVFFIGSNIGCLYR